MTTKKPPTRKKAARKKAAKRKRPPAERLLVVMQGFVLQWPLPTLPRRGGPGTFVRQDDPFLKVKGIGVDQRYKLRELTEEEHAQGYVDLELHPGMPAERFRIALTPCNNRRMHEQYQELGCEWMPLHLDTFAPTKPATPLQDEGAEAAAAATQDFEVEGIDADDLGLDDPDFLEGVTIRLRSARVFRVLAQFAQFPEHLFRVLLGSQIQQRVDHRQSFVAARRLPPLPAVLALVARRRVARALQYQGHQPVATSYSYWGRRGAFPVRQARKAIPRQPQQSALAWGADRSGLPPLPYSHFRSRIRLSPVPLRLQKYRPLLRQLRQPVLSNDLG